MKSDPNSRLSLCAALLPFVAAVPLACLCAPAALAEEQSPHSAPEQTTPRLRHQRPGLDNRARRLAKMLELTEAQQAELAKVLASQREQIRKLWSDQRVAPEYRVSEMRAINDQTEDRIRALLNDEQKKKYVSSRPRESPRTSQQSDLDHWLNATKPK
jgi:septal ring factor EnvC (AmiA/AmiB activator)